jgi:hypothetical protein
LSLLRSKEVFIAGWYYILFMNLEQIKCLSVFAVFAIIGFGPISPGCLIGMFVVLIRPKWFLALTLAMYRTDCGKGHLEELDNINYVENARIKVFCSLVTLFLIDIAPVPVTPVIAFCIILMRPLWFYRLVDSVYSSD